MNLLPDEILETIDMVEMQHLDVRTVTMGISLLDCINASAEKTAENIYNKIIKNGKDLVKIANEVASKYNMPIINKRVSVTPISIIGNATDAQDYTILQKLLIKRQRKLELTLLEDFQLLLTKALQKAILIL